jgi:catechol 2,3-dioxygenase-like lactoylglutathione lyase family enzyme
MEALRLGKLVVFVTSIDEVKRFYGEVLGLSLVREADGMLLFRQPDFELAAFLCEQPSVADRHSKVAGSTFVFSVPSVERAMRELRAKGVRFLQTAPAEGPLGRYAAFADPFGNVHEISEPGGRIE